jgi:hypothetical protein
MIGFRIQELQANLRFVKGDVSASYPASSHGSSDTSRRAFSAKKKIDENLDERG